MRRRIPTLALAGALAATIACAGTAQAETTTSARPIGFSGTIKDQIPLACRSLDIYLKVARLVSQNDIDAARTLAITNGCTALPAGAVATIMDKAPLADCLRVEGTAECYWVFDVWKHK